MLYTKFQDSLFLDFVGEDFQQVFTIYMGMAAILVSWPESFEWTFLPPLSPRRINLKYGHNWPCRFREVAWTIDENWHSTSMFTNMQCFHLKILSCDALKCVCEKQNLYTVLALLLGHPELSYFFFNLGLTALSRFHWNHPNDNHWEIMTLSWLQLFPHLLLGA